MTGNRIYLEAAVLVNYLRTGLSERRKHLAQVSY